jgi:type I restriction enzyme R subunit
MAARNVLVSQHRGLGKVHQLFGDKLNTIIEELNETLAA